MGRSLCAVAALVLVLPAASRPAPPACGNPAAGAAYTQQAVRALRAGTDVWGNALLRLPGGPTLEGARRDLAPLLLARAPKQLKLTVSGVYYVPFADPPAPAGADALGLHVADGGQILADRVGGRSLTVAVGGERYGSCLGRLVPARLKDGYLPVLETGYVDASGVRYTQESFTSGGTSYVALHADRDAAARFTASGTQPLTLRGRDAHIAWPHDGAARVVERGAFDAVRDAYEGRWKQRLDDGTAIDVPEQEVKDALRALRVQNLLLGWRYSVGNPYEELSFPEAPDVAGVMGEQGFGDVERAILETSLRAPSTRYANWKRGERLQVSAAYFRLYRDRAFLDAATPRLAGFVAVLERDLQPNGLLRRERYSSDIADSVYGFHAQAVAWAGLREMADVWAETGRAQLASRARALAQRLELGLRRAVRSSQRRLGDGSLFVPARLLDGERPYRSLVEARLGSYWNLVMPFGFATGFFPPRSAEARGVLRYMLRHGSRLLGLVRAGAYALYGRDAPFPVSGTDQVYGVNVARFLADNGEADQLVLSLYGQLAAAMTPGTFVAGEGASVAPLDGRRYRAMYLPPNSASNAAFLETLRVMLVHETRAGLELAYSTPRAWLRSGRRIKVERAPTRFGPVSFSIAVDGDTAHVRVDVPSRAAPATLLVRMRLPAGRRVARVSAGRLDRATGTIDLSGRRGRVELDAALTGR